VSERVGRVSGVCGVDFVCVFGKGIMSFESNQLI